MDVDSVSRWEEPIPKKRRKNKESFIYATVLSSAIIVFGVSRLFAPDNDEAKSPVQISESVANELRAAIGPLPGSSESELGENVAKLIVRVGALEAENQRLRAEMDQLVDHDGVIERLVTHVRALHAQSEATRRDVVNALMEPIQNGDQPAGVDGMTQTPSLEGEANPLLTKARHTIVTPVVVTAATPEKRKEKPAPAEPEEGNTN